MNTGTTGNTGGPILVHPGGQLKTPEGVFYCHARACFFRPYSQSFSAWEVALTAIVVVVLVAMVALFVRRMRVG